MREQDVYSGVFWSPRLRGCWAEAATDEHKGNDEIQRFIVRHDVPDRN
jgi:hypothetical protein